MSESKGLYIPPDHTEANLSTGHYVQRETIFDSQILVEDPQLGEIFIGGRSDVEKLFYAFYTTPAAMRAGGISQLSKTESIATIPNLASFTRRSGLIAQHGLIEYMARGQEFTDDQLVAFHVAAEGDDMAHLIMSHGVEQSVQGWGGPESWHHQVWPLMARLGGITDVLKDVKLNKHVRVRGVKIPPWVVGELPDIDMDNFQYIASEALLWFDHDGADPRVRERVRDAVNPNNIEITPDGQLAFKDERQALVFSKLLLLFTTEHYNDALNRCQLHLINQGVQRAVVRRRIPWMNEVDLGETRKPKDYLFMIDDDLVQALQTGPGSRDDFMYAVRNSLRRTGSEERERFIDYKLPRYTAFILDDSAEDYPSEHLTSKRVDFGPSSSSVQTTVRPYTEQDRDRQGTSKLPVLDGDTEAIRYVAPPFKDRSINPLVRHGNGYKRLEELNKNYRRLKEQHAVLQQQAVVVELVFTEEHSAAFREGVAENQREFEQAKKRDRLTDDQKRRIIEIGAQRAMELSQQAGTLVLKRAA